MALYVTIYLALMGTKGLKEVNELSFSGAHYLAEQLCKTGKFEMAYPQKPYLNEFTLKTSLDINKLQNVCAENGILAGVKIASDKLLLCVTELRSKAEIDNLVDIVKSF
jgi:glycine dehydrogenase subunit 1